MKELTGNQREKLAELERLYRGPTGRRMAPVGTSMAMPETNALSSLCESFKRQEKMQYGFMIFYQILVAIFAVAVVAALIFTVWRATTDGAGDAIAEMLGTIVGGGACGFVINQRRDARDTHVAAQAGLEKHNCP